MTAPDPEFWGGIPARWRLLYWVEALLRRRTLEVIVLGLVIAGAGAIAHLAGSSDIVLLLVLGGVALAAGAACHTPPVH